MRNVVDRIIKKLEAESWYEDQYDHRIGECVRTGVTIVDIEDVKKILKEELLKECDDPILEYTEYDSDDNLTHVWDSDGHEVFYKGHMAEKR